MTSSPFKNNTYLQFQKLKFTSLKAEHPSWPSVKIQEAVKKEWQKKTTNRKTPKQNEGSANQNLDNIQSISEQRSSSKKDTVSKKLFFQKNKSEQVMKVNPVKKIKKITKKSDKKQFDQFYNQKLSKEHPTWSVQQIKNIIKLLWRKKNHFEPKKRQDLPKLSNRKMSGKSFFTFNKKKQGLHLEDIQRLWNQLPRQTKLYWTQLGGKANLHQKEQVKNQQKNAQPLSFMNKIM